MVSVKLSRDNYLLWKAQVVPILRGHQLLGFLNGATPAPPARVPKTTEKGADLVRNPAYVVWYAQDQLLLAALIATLAPEVQARLLGLDSSVAAWVALEWMYAFSSHTRIAGIRKQLAIVKKKDMTMSDYFA